MTNTRTERAVKKSLLALSALAMAAGCTTTIPETDTTPPRVELQISGPGVGSESMSNPPRDLWQGPGGVQYFDLVPGAEYGFTLIVSDDGGVSRATLALPDNLAVSNVEPAGVVTTMTGGSRRLTIEGNRADPRTALTITGRMGTGGGSGLLFAYNAEGNDFGGRSGPPNQTFLSVEVFIPPAGP
jgi:hypothetical protein